MMGGQDFGSSLGIIGILFNLLFTFLFIGGFILLVYWIVKQFTPVGPVTPTISSNALEILKERFAKGEITEREYKKMKKEISN